MLRFLTLAIAAIAVAAPSAQAASDHTAPPGNSGVDQYFEAVPSAGGPTRPGGTPSAGKALPKRVQQSLAAQGSDGEAVLRLVQSTAPPGAPKAAGEKGSSSSKSTTGSGSSPSTATGNDAAPSGSVLASTAKAVQLGGERGGMGALLPILLVITAVAASAYVVMRRRSGER